MYHSARYVSLQEQTHFNGYIFGNKSGRYNVGVLQFVNSISSVIFNFIFTIHLDKCIQLTRHAVL